MSYEDIKKKYSKAASEQSGKVKLARMKVERMEAAYEDAESEWREAVNEANRHICKETAEAKIEAASRMRQAEQRLEEARRELGRVEVSDEQLASVMDKIC
jgi:predicted GNAT family N-acyltransferase